MLNKEQLLELGFKELPHFTVTSSLTYDLGRNRFLSIVDVGTPNEILFIYEKDFEDERKINDIVTLSNFNYDGYLTVEKLSLLLTFFARNKENTGFKWGDTVCIGFNMTLKDGSTEFVEATPHILIKTAEENNKKK